MKSNVKIASYTWWICGILGLFIGLSEADGRINRYDLMALAGIFNGIIWGWLIGFIIDKIKDSSLVHNISQKIKEVKQDKEIVQQKVNSLEDYNDAKHRFQYLSDDTLVDKYKSYFTNDIIDMERLALEEELVKRGILNYSPSHEKLEKVRKHLKI